MPKSFDVFLSHNSKDKPAVRELAAALRARGLKVWLDEWELVPGRSWQRALEEVIETAGASAVLVGKDGFGPWQEEEMRGCLSEFVRRKLPVIPVLLPGAPEEPRLPFFLTGLTWVDLRRGLTEEGLDQLEWGVTGSRPNRANASIPAPAPEPLPNRRVRPRWSVFAGIGLLTLLGISVFLLSYYLPRYGKPQVEEPGAIDRPVDTPGTKRGKPQVENEGAIDRPVQTPGTQRGELQEGAVDQPAQTPSTTEKGGPTATLLELSVVKRDGSVITGVNVNSSGADEKSFSDQQLTPGPASMSLNPEDSYSIIWRGGFVSQGEATLTVQVSREGEAARRKSFTVQGTAGESFVRPLLLP